MVVNLIHLVQIREGKLVYHTIQVPVVKHGGIATEFCENRRSVTFVSVFEFCYAARKHNV